MWDWWDFFSRGFWRDEAWTALTVQLPLSDMLKVTATDFHPPLYFLLAHSWTQIFGMSEPTLRSLSLLFHLISLPFIYALTKIFVRSRLNRTLVTLALTLAPVSLTFAMEARGYSLLTLLSIVTTWSFWHYLKAGHKRNLIIYIVSSILLMYTNYFGFFTVAGQAIFAFWQFPDKRRQLLKLYSGLGVTQLGWIPVLWHQISQVSSGYWIDPLDGDSHWEFFKTIVTGDYYSRWRTPVSLAFFGMLCIKFQQWLPARKASRKDSYLWVCLATLILIPTAISLFMPIFYYRYLTFAIIPIILLVTRYLEQLPGKYIATSLLICLSLVFGRINYLKLSQVQYTMKQAIPQFLQDHPEATELYTNDLAFPEVAYYLPPAMPLLVDSTQVRSYTGKSLLDEYEQRGWIQLAEVPVNTPYWFANVGPEITLVEPNFDDN